MNNYSNKSFSQENTDNNKKQDDLPFNPKPGKTPKKFKFNIYWVYALIALALIAMQFYSWSPETKEISKQKLYNELLPKGDVEKIIVVNKEYAEVYIKKEKVKDYKDLDNKGVLNNKIPHYIYKLMTIEQFEKDMNEKYPYVNIEQQSRKDWSSDILNLIFTIGFIVLLFVLFMRLMNRGGGGGGTQIFNFGKSKAQVFDKDTQINVNFNDVAGLDEAKVEVMEIVDFLKNPTKYTQLGGKIPKGALLVGPPGTGKTLLAKAVAGEAQVPFLSLSGSDFVEMFVGVGASRVRDLFKTAKSKAPCIIFIDEIDAIGRSRARQTFTGANDERENTLNQLLTEMDGFANNTGVIILAATNRADVLDRALLRAGRFDRQIHVELPDLEGRKAIFKVHLNPIKIDQTVEVDFIARQTPGFSGADIANVCNEAALIAARNNKTLVGKEDFIAAVDRIIGGLEKKSKIISQDEKKVIAFHESGHAAVSWLLQYAHPLVKVTIVPRGKSLGAAWYLPEERQITTYEQMMDEIIATLAGRASEDVFFSKISTGALNDLERVTKQVYSMVVFYGLNDKIGNISYYDSSGQQEYNFTKPYSEKTAEMIDMEIRQIVESAYQKAKDILTTNKEKVEQLAILLLEKEVIFREDLETIFGKRQWEDKHI
ncbi:MAG: ATP-dependent zinc metalloprotease FtsH [Bacteroidales bacterium]|nr:ATP-dependent zinc metalloprotease FtsH [Bacteroidales bacterium]